MGKLRIISRSSEAFRDRKEAGMLLAKELKGFSGKDTVILGIPRGGVVIANEIARALNADLDIVLSRKIGAPGNPELAIGSINEDGKLFLNEDLAHRVGADKRYIEAERAEQLSEIKRRVQIFRKAKAKVALSGKTVIVTDDGIATGATMQAALWACRQEQPKRLIAAVPVGAADTVELMASHADEIVVLRVPDDLMAISRFYVHFDQTSDDEVIAILQEEKLFEREVVLHVEKILEFRQAPHSDTEEH